MSGKITQCKCCWWRHFQFQSYLRVFENCVYIIMQQLWSAKIKVILLTYVSMITNSKGPLLKLTNLAPPRIGTKQNETKRRRSIVNRLISEISWFWIVECWRVCQRTCTISIEQFITHTYHDLRTYGQFSDILRMRHLRSIIVNRRCTSYTYFAVSLSAELP